MRHQARGVRHQGPAAMSDERGNGNDRDDVMEEDDERRVRATYAPACTRASATTASPGQARRSCRRGADGKFKESFAYLANRF